MATATQTLRKPRARTARAGSAEPVFTGDVEASRRLHVCAARADRDGLRDPLSAHQGDLAQLPLHLAVWRRRSSSSASITTKRRYRTSISASSSRTRSSGPSRARCSRSSSVGGGDPPLPPDPLSRFLPQRSLHPLCDRAGHGGVYVEVDVPCRFRCHQRPAHPDAPHLARRSSSLTRTNLVLPSLIAVNVWKEFPFAMIMLLAGLQAIPDNSTTPRRLTARAAGALHAISPSRS